MTIVFSHFKRKMQTELYVAVPLTAAAAAAVAVAVLLHPTKIKRNGRHAIHTNTALNRRLTA